MEGEQEDSLRPRLSVRRRPTDHELSVRPQLSRVPTDLLPPPMMSGQFTPELSPLDAFVSRGRQMYRELGMQDKIRANSETGHSQLSINANAAQQAASAQQGYFAQVSPKDRAPPQQIPQVNQPDNGAQQQQQQRPKLPVAPAFVRSHTADPSATNEAQSLNRAVENWSIGQATNSRGNPRETKLFMGNAAKQPAGAAAGQQPPYPHAARSSSLKKYEQHIPPGALHHAGNGAPGPSQGMGTGPTVHEPTFRPVSQHPRISGIGIELHDEGPSHTLTVHQPIARHASQHPRISAIDPGEQLQSPQMPAARDSSLTRSQGSSPRSPRMPTFGDDSDDDDISFTMTINSVSSKKEYARGRPDMVQHMGDTRLPRSNDRAVSNPLDDQLSPRSQAHPLLTKQPSFPQRKSSKDSYAARSPVSPSTSQRGQRLPTPPKSASPTTFYGRQNEVYGGGSSSQYQQFSQQQQYQQQQQFQQQQQQQQFGGSLGAPTIPAAHTSTPNLSSHDQQHRYHHNHNDSDSSPVITQSPIEASGELFLPPQPAFAASARSAPTTPRPTSAMSDAGSIYSIGGSKRAMNFSRPMSKQSFHHSDGTEFAVPLRKASSDMSNPRRQYSTDSEDERAQQQPPYPPTATRTIGAMDIDRPSPLQALTHLERVPSGGHRHQGSGSGKAGPSENYTYTQFTLPRGRQVNRESVIMFGEKHKFPSRDDGVVPHSAGYPPPVPPSPNGPLTPTAPTVPLTPTAPLTPGAPHTPNAPVTPTTDHPEGGLKSPRSPWENIPVPPRPSADIRQSADVFNGGRPSHDSSTPRPSMAASRRRSSSAGASLKPEQDGPKRPVTSGGAHALTPEQHLDIAIPLHEKGSYAESTYHFRLAALGGNSTGMLLYGLALRHGWGIRVSSTEAVNWLKKAADLAQSEMSSIEPDKPKPDWYQNKAQRARFALAAYELGVSNLKGWGIPINESLALNFFEIAASWGDTDAMQEAGNCYATGVGCKKDLKKSAKYYRLAEANGVSMVGQSWIWKDKYLDDEDRAKLANKDGKDKPHKENSKKDKKKDKEKDHGKFGRKKGSW